MCICSTLYFSSLSIYSINERSPALTSDITSNIKQIWKKKSLFPNWFPKHTSVSGMFWEEQVVPHSAEYRLYVTDHINTELTRAE